MTEPPRTEGEWSVPPELSVPTPRPIRKVKSARGCLRIFHIVFATIFFIFFFFVVTAWLVSTFTSPSGRVREQRQLAVMLESFFLFCAGVSLPYLILTRRKKQYLMRWGKPARAVVIKARQAEAKPPVYGVKVEYQDEAGNRVRGSTTVRADIEVGQVVTVLYDPNKPQRCLAYPVDGFEVGEDR